MPKHHIKAIIANVIWGSLPIYFFLIGQYPPLLLLSVQMVTTFIVVAILILCDKEHKFSLGDLGRSFFPSILLSINWGGYAVAVKSGFVIEASYAYLILPVLILTISIFLDENIDKWKLVSIFSCVIIIAVECYANGVFPFIGFAISAPFAAYILWHKKYNLPPLRALFYETALMLPVALLIYLFSKNQLLVSFPIENIIGLSILGGLTVLPLVLFVSSTKFVSFNVLSIYQLISPILGICIGIYLYNQDVNKGTIAAYVALTMVIAFYNIYLFRKGHKAHV
jgi:chloramphenicol-sensitive protein RarD